MASGSTAAAGPDILEAAKAGDLVTVEELLSSDPSNLETKDAVGQTALHWAAAKGHGAVVRRLLEARAAVEAKDNRGGTPLDIALRRREWDVVRVLRPVFVALLSGRTVRCDPSADRTVQELLEEAQQKLDMKISRLITAEGEMLSPETTLAAAGLSEGGRITAVAKQEPLCFAEEKHGVLLSAAWRDHETHGPHVQLLQEFPEKVSGLEGLVPASPLIQLTPEGVAFAEAVRLLVPASKGASKVWRSTENGWEEIPALFRNGYAEIHLYHFCQLVATQDPPENLAVKAIGFINARPVAKVAFLEVGCQRSSRLLDKMLLDEDFLAGFSRCNAELFDGSAPRTLRVLQDRQAAQTVQLGAGRPPHITRAFRADTPTSFEVILEEEGDISRRLCKFEAEDAAMPPSGCLLPPHADAGTSPGAPSQQTDPAQPVAGEIPSASSSRRVEGNSASPSPAASFGYSPPPPLQPTSPSSVAPSRGRRPLPQIIRPCPIPEGTESSSQAQPAQRTKLMLSGRFNKKEMKEFIQEVKEKLEAKGVPAYMVQAGPSQTFNNRTVEGMYCAKKLVAFCTEDYGAKTGAGYETYFELQKAWEKQLPIIPIRLCEAWPPQPRDSDGGEAGKMQNDFILSSSLVYIDGRKMPIDELVSAIEDAWHSD